MGLAVLVVSSPTISYLENERDTNSDKYDRLLKLNVTKYGDAKVQL